MKPSWIYRRQVIFLFETSIHSLMQLKKNKV